MAGSSMCPCSACYNTKPAHQPLRPEHEKPTPQLRWKKDKNIFSGRLRRTRSSETMASDLVVLSSSAQPMAGLGEEK